MLRQNSNCLQNTLNTLAIRRNRRRFNSMQSRLFSLSIQDEFAVSNLLCENGISYIDCKSVHGGTIHNIHYVFHLVYSLAGVFAILVNLFNR